MAVRLPVGFLVDALGNGPCEDDLELKLETDDAGIGVGLAEQARILDVVVVP